jgi:hypothetical protein
MNYYNELPSPYHHRLEEKFVDNLSSAMHTFLEYVEQLERIGLPQGEAVKQTYMSSLLQLVQDMNNRMIVYERKGNASALTLGASSSSTPPFRNTNENNFQSNIMPRSLCNFFEEHHEETTCCKCVEPTHNRSS